jgi:hypothetical protein
MLFAQYFVLEVAGKPISLELPALGFLLLVLQCGTPAMQTRQRGGGFHLGLLSRRSVADPH